MKEEILIHYDEKKGKAVFKCGYCDYGKVQKNEMKEIACGWRVVVAGEFECQVCKGTGVRILDIPKI